VPGARGPQALETVGGERQGTLGGQLPCERSGTAVVLRREVDREEVLAGFFKPAGELILPPSRAWAVEAADPARIKALAAGPTQAFPTLRRLDSYPARDSLTLLAARAAKPP
jgi:hypothetical protein